MLRRDHSVLALALGGSFLLSLTLLTRSGVVALLFSTVAFTAFDVIGFKILLAEGHQEDEVPYYRVIQVAFQAQLYLLVWFIAGWQAAAASAFVWWTGGCDLAYYWIGKYPLHRESWTWLWWTPVGAVLHLVKFLTRPKSEIIDLPLSAVIVQAAVGMVIAVGGVIWL